MRTALESHASLRWTPPPDYHRRIAEAIAARDVAAATEAVGAHFQYTQDRLHAADGAATAVEILGQPRAIPATGPEPLAGPAHVRREGGSMRG
jgi:hypothetical protein